MSSSPSICPPRFLTKLPNHVVVGVIDVCPIASSDIVKEPKPVRIILGDLASIISLKIIRSLAHPIVVGLHWFELHNPEDLLDEKNN